MIDLGVDAAGRLAGTGELVLTGHQAWERIHWKEDDAKTSISTRTAASNR